MLRKLYDWIIAYSAKPSAPWALFIVAFAESSVFPVPPDVLQVPMTLARPDKAWRYALIATIGSVLGGLVGYAIGAAGIRGSQSPPAPTQGAGRSGCCPQDRTGATAIPHR